MSGEENRMFVKPGGGDVLELDTSTTTFTKVRTITTGPTFRLCYVPDPHRLLVGGGVRAVSCDDNTVLWRKPNNNFSLLLYVPSHDVILVADRSHNVVSVLDPSSGSQMQMISLPDVLYVQGLCLRDGQIVVATKDKKDEKEGNYRISRIAYFSLSYVNYFEKILNLFHRL